MNKPGGRFRKKNRQIILAIPIIITGNTVRTVPAPVLYYRTTTTQINIPVARHPPEYRWIGTVIAIIVTGLPGHKTCRFRNRTCRNTINRPDMNQAFFIIRTSFKNIKQTMLTIKRGTVQAVIIIDFVFPIQIFFNIHARIRLWFIRIH